MSRAGAIVGIENCRSLDIMLVPAEELRARRLRAVLTPSPDLPATLRA